MRVGYYEIIDKVGEGGTATVYRARDVRLGEQAPVVVVKRLGEEAAADPDFVDRFLAEIDLCRRFNHPNVVRTLDFGSDSDSYFVVLGYVDGQNFETALARARQLNILFPREFVLYIVDEALKGLAYAHEATSAKGERLGLVHRDVSPHNVFCSYDGHILLGDFGVALLPGLDDAAGQRLTMGKLGYLSPEQCFGEPVDQRSDLFSMAVVLAEGLSGQRLFAHRDNESDQDVMRRIGEGERPKFAELDAGLRFVLHKALAHSVTKRFQTVAEFRRALVPFLNPDIGNTLAIAALLRLLFRDEFKRTRMRGSPLTF